jgi:Zn ribbon nucleic-acid-binding protein
MTFTQEQKDKIAEWRSSKGIEKCIACGFSGEMHYGDVIVLPVSGFGGPTVISGFGGQTVVSGTGGGVFIDGEEIGPAGGMVPVTCPECGYTMLFSEEVLPL